MLQLQPTLEGGSNGAPAPSATAEQAILECVEDGCRIRSWQRSVEAGFIRDTWGLTSAVSALPDPTV